jgi:Acetyltransferases, including N-acetylases of ribosomal proteins
MFVKSLYDMEDVKQNFGGVPRPLTRSRFEEKVEKFENSSPEAYFVIEFNSEPVGQIKLQDIDEFHRTANLTSLALKPDIRGDGVGKSAIEMVIRYGLNELNLHKIRADIIEGNEQGSLVLEKCGFEEEGILEEEIFRNGNYLDVIRFRKF